MSHRLLQKKVRISAKLVFQTAFHIGSGKEGQNASDMGVMKDEQGWPVLPGSSIKGCFRSNAEKLASYLGMSACLLDSDLSGLNCVSDQGYFKTVHDEFKKLNGEKQKVEWLKDHVCDVCNLFGSPMQSSRIFFSDGMLTDWGGSHAIRDGVVIDRDSGTARDGLKFDFEVSSRDTVFNVVIDLENPLEEELALVGAVLSEWETGFKLGGFKTRGLGQVVLSDKKIEYVDYSNHLQLKDFLMHRKMQEDNNLLDNALKSVLEQLPESEGGAAC